MQQMHSYTCLSVCFSSVLFLCECCGDVDTFIPLRGCGVARAKSSVLDGRRPGYSLNESPAPLSRTDGRGCHTGAIAHEEQFWGSVSCSRALRHVPQVLPRGAGIQTSDLPITSPPALPQYAFLLLLSLLKQHGKNEQAVLNRHSDLKKYPVAINGKQ